MGAATTVLWVANLVIAILLMRWRIGGRPLTWSVRVHTSDLFAMDHNGPELVTALGLLSLVLAVTGSGRFGLDHLIVRRLRRTSRTTA
jgi:putative oxidoreductase